MSKYNIKVSFFGGIYGYRWAITTTRGKVVEYGFCRTETIAHQVAREYLGSIVYFAK